MKNILFIGAGGFASECYQYLLDIMAHDKNIKFKGFLSTSNDLACYGLDKFFLGDYNDYSFQKDDYVVIAIGMPAPRKKLYNLLKSRGCKFYNLISPKAYLSADLVIGEANVIGPFVLITPNTKIGNGNLLQPFSGAGHDATIGDFNFIGARSSFAGWSSIGNDNLIAIATILLPHAKIGNNCKISANSVVFKKIKDNSIVIGNPAEVIGLNED